MGLSGPKKSLKTPPFSLSISLTQIVDIGGVNTFWLASQAEDIKAQSLPTSIVSVLLHPSPMILSYLARRGSIPLKRMELNSLSNAWNLYTLRSIVKFNQVLGHKINSSTFETKTDFLVSFDILRVR